MANPKEQRHDGILYANSRIVSSGYCRDLIGCCFAHAPLGDRCAGLNGYLYGAGVPMANFKKHAKEVTKRLEEESLRHARRSAVRFDTWKAARIARKIWLRKSPSGTASGTD